jgi:putative ABC transport system permease protein
MQMNLYVIAFNNLMRRRIKMLLILGGLVAGIAAAVALFMIVESMRLSLGDQIDEFGANLIIVPRAEGMEISYGGTNVSSVSIGLEQLTEADLEKIREIPDYNSINVISPKMVTAVSANGKEALLVGVEPEREFIMKPWYSLSDQSGLPEGASPDDLALIELPGDSLIIGSEAARALGLRAGDELTVNGSPFKVLGILKPMGAVEDGLIYGNLTAVQTLMGRPGEISMIEISAYCNACPVEEIAAQLTAVLPNGRVTALRQAALLRSETIDRFALFSVLLATIFLSIAALLVLTTMMAAVHERTREIGIFRAIGFRSAHVVQIIFMEAGMIGFLGGLFGFLAGSLAANAAGPYLTGNSSPVSWQPGLLLPAIILAVLVAVAATAYPALRAAKLNPVDALRFI